MLRTDASALGDCELIAADGALVCLEVFLDLIDSDGSHDKFQNNLKGMRRDIYNKCRKESVVEVGVGGTLHWQC
jgi:hypothetical protein